LFGLFQFPTNYLFGLFLFCIFVDYVLPGKTNILLLGVKAGVQGGMKSLWE